jgi:uncharacterized delta-60 repeat protein
MVNLRGMPIYLSAYRTGGRDRSNPLVETLESRLLLAGQIFVTNHSSNTVGEYDATGTAINPSLITGLNGPFDIAVSGSDLFVTNNGGTTLGEYTTSGVVVNSHLITGLDFPSGVVASGSDLFVVNQGNGSAGTGSIGEYTLSGTTVNALLIPGLSDPGGIAISGSNLFVVQDSIGTIAEYTTAGATVNTALITALNDPNGIAVSGSDLFVSSYSDNSVGEYTTSGTTVNSSLISDLNGPTCVTVSGSDLLVTNYQGGTVGEYFTSGPAINPSLISSGLDSPDGIAVAGNMSNTPQLVFSQQPANTTAGTLPPITVDVDDSNGNLLNTDNSDVTLSLAGGSTGATLGGTTTVAAVDGVATFSNLSIATAGDGYTLTATDGTDTSATSSSFNVTPGSTGRLAFNQQPVTTTTATALSPITVDVEDPNGNLLTTDTSNVSLSLTNSPAGVTLGGTTTVAAVNGVATFSNLTINIAGTYSLTAIDGSETAVTSQNFNITVPPKTIGELDPTFGTDGLAAHDVGFASTTGVAQYDNQSILIGPIGSSPDESFGVTRYNADGSLDTSFGSDGVTSTTFGSTDDVPKAVDVLANGNILVAGTATTFTNGAASGSEFAVAEYNSNGSLDTSFGSGTGKVLVSFSSTTTLSNDVLNAMVVTAAGEIYLGGSSDAGKSDGTQFAIAALAVNSGFNATGNVLQSFGSGDDVVNSLALQSDGDIVAAGSATINGLTEIALARFLPTGILDKRFGNKGLVTTDVRGVYDSASSMVIEPKGGQIIVGGVSATGSGASLSSDFVLVRYTSAGRLDRSFGGGPVVTSFNEPSAITQLVLASNGEIVASGKSTSNLNDIVPDDLDVAIARYTTSGVLDTTFDGTGKTLLNPSSGVIGTADTLTKTITAQFTIQPFDASSLGAEFAAFISSAQGVVSLTPGGEILDAGNSGSDTVEAELITAGVDLAASLLASLPAAVTGGSKALVTVTITESGTDQATGTVTIDLELADDAQGDGETTFKTLPENINLREKQSRSYHISFLYPSSITAGSYYLVADVDNGSSATLADLDPENNLAASKAAVSIAPPFVSLTGSSLSTTSTFTLDKPAAIEFTLTNNGNVPAKGTITVDVILSTDQTAADGTIIDPVKLVVSLSAGKSKPNRISFKLPSTITAGSYYLIAVIDPTDSIGSDDKTSSTVVDATQMVVG